MSVQQTLFIALFTIAVAAFLFSCRQRLQLVRLGVPEARFDKPGERLLAMLISAFAQQRVLARPFGINHFLIFWAFLVLLLANGEFLLAGLVPGFTLATLVSPELYHFLELSFDAVSLVTLVCVLVASVRRLFFPPPYLGNDYTSAASFEAMLILVLIALLMIAFFMLNAVQIVMAEATPWRPVATLLAGMLHGLSGPVLSFLGQAAWWLHALVLLLFMNLLPRSKHMHILTAIPNCYFQSLDKPILLLRESFTPGARYGVSSVGQFSWKDLLDTFTCTECGRCQDLCPAHNTAKPLNPRRIIHDIKVNLLENGPALKSGIQGTVALIGTAGEGTIPEEAIWSCTTCGACTSVCPVLIEQMPKIVKLRRHLVQDKAAFPEELLNLFENMEQRSNPWGIAPGERSKWSTLLGDRSFKAGETEYLFFVGCAGAFDSRNKQVTMALATIMDLAGISWGVLGKDEPCCGDSVRRLGNEYLFERLARENVARFRENEVTKVVTHCPHCFSTLKNDYRQYGLELEILHHSQLLAHLLESGRLRIPPQTGLGKVIFHDSCYLGRHNDTYAPPRTILAAATGKAPEEFGRNREQSFCCGAGGGRMWLEEQSGTRINLERVREAMLQHPETLCVSCPYCLTMMEDGLKDLGLADQVRVRDIAELVTEALR
jgi:Fe-S oxidoreductase